MMSVLEYANDVNKPIEEITKLCQKLNIAIEDENTMLDDDAIIMLDNEIANLTSEDNLDSIDEDDEEMPQSEDDITDSYEEELEEVTTVNTKKKHKSNSPKTNNEDFKSKRKNMYKNKEKLQSNAVQDDDSIVLYKENMTVSELAQVLKNKCCWNY